MKPNKINSLSFRKQLYLAVTNNNNYNNQTLSLFHYLKSQIFYNMFLKNNKEPEYYATHSYILSSKWTELSHTNNPFFCHCLKYDQLNQTIYILSIFTLVSPPRYQ